MAELVADCPRCGSKEITFDLLQSYFIKSEIWKYYFETFCVCRRCNRATIFVLGSKSPNYTPPTEIGRISQIQGCVNQLMEVVGYVNIKNLASERPPEYVPADIAEIFKEGATCLAVECYNAAATMFRLCVDLATRTKLPVSQAGQQDAPGLNTDVRSKLALRLQWLFDNRYLPEDLRDLSTCIKDDGNDGAHNGNLDKDAANDLLDFTIALLERMFTEPKQVQLAKERRDARREKLNPAKSPKTK